MRVDARQIRSVPTCSSRASIDITPGLCAYITMASRNIYVSAEAQPLFDEAATLATSLSAAIEEGLRLYVARKRLQQEGFSLIQIVVDERTLEFAGRLLLTSEIEHKEGRVRSVSIYLTAKRQLVATETSRPDYGAVAGLHDRGELWDEMSDERWWESKVTSFEVYPTFEELEQAALVSPSHLATVRELMSQPKNERLDI